MLVIQHEVIIAVGTSTVLFGIPRTIFFLLELQMNGIIVAHRPLQIAVTPFGDSLLHLFLDSRMIPVANRLDAMLVKETIHCIQGKRQMMTIPERSPILVGDGTKRQQLMIGHLLEKLK